MTSLRLFVLSFPLALILLSIASCSNSSGIDVLTTPEHEALKLPFSQAVEAGGLIFVSGQLGTRVGTADLVEGGIKEETRYAMMNIQAILERYGSSLDQVAKCTIFIDDIDEWATMNEVYVSFFPNHKPARSAVGADGLGLGGAVEIECIALR